MAIKDNSSEKKNVVELLKDKNIISRAPLRVACGGTWDISALFLPYTQKQPCTVNMAIDRYVTVSLLPYAEGKIKVSSKGFDSEEASTETAPFNSPLGLIFAVATYFQYDGVHIKIDTNVPTRSGLGGSGVVAVATVNAFSQVEHLYGRKKLNRLATALLAQSIEQGLQVGITGLQDQLAACYGGVNLWVWKGAPIGVPFTRKKLLLRDSKRKLIKHIALAYSGVTHDSSSINKQFIVDFEKGTTRKIWLEINKNTRIFAQALTTLDWKLAASALLKETSLRKEMNPQYLTTTAQDLVSIAQETGCGSRPAGAGGGGCVWAIGPMDNIERLKRKWSTMLEQTSGELLDINLDFQGVCPLLSNAQ
jgi:D-glycero-alpha-D-manno-heptose-7-phosphate kinase